MPIRLALDPVLKYAARLGKLSNNLVATPTFAISTKTGRKVQGLSNGKFMRSHVLLQQSGVPPSPATLYGHSVLRDLKVDR